MIPLGRVPLIRLQNWCDMEYLYTYLDCNGGKFRNISQEGFDFLSQEYFAKLKRRIAYCESISPKDAFVLYTLAELYNRVDVDGPKENLFKRKARYYAIRAIRKNKKYSKAWALLADTYSWLSLIGGEEKGRDRSIFFIERAITLIKKAIEFDPVNLKYREDLKGYYFWRNEAYKC